MAKRQLNIEEIASEVGRLFGTTEAHARRWLEKRNELVSALSIVRERAGALISELGGDGRAGEGIPIVQPGMRESRKKRVLSAQTRAKMRAAARRRWAQIKNKSRAK